METMGDKQKAAACEVLTKVICHHTSAVPALAVGNPYQFEVSKLTKPHKRTTPWAVRLQFPSLRTPVRAPPDKFFAPARSGKQELFLTRGTHRSNRMTHAAEVAEHAGAVRIEVEVPHAVRVVGVERTRPVAAAS